MSSRVHFRKAAFIGVGLIGGSLAIELRQKGIASHITGIGRGLENLVAAKRLGVVDDFTQDIAEGVRGADLVFVAVPVLKIADVIKKAAAHLERGAIITDAGSVKQAIMDEVSGVLPHGVHFVPGHPIAGTENSGVEAAFPGLYVGRKCILTPAGSTDKVAVEKVRMMWEEAGSQVIIMDAAAHDMILAAVSHLPHMIAYSLVNTVADMDEAGTDAIEYSAGGFRDFTRIASSSPEMWGDICVMNRGPIIEMIESFQKRLQALKNHIEKNDLAALRDDFSRAKRVRDSLVNKRQA